MQTGVYNYFKDLLNSAGLTQRIIRNGHTFDLIIDRHEDTKLSSFSTGITGLRTFHLITMPRSAPLRSQNLLLKSVSSNNDVFEI